LRLSFPVLPNQSPCSVAPVTESEQTNGTVAATKDDDNEKKSGPGPSSLHCLQVLSFLAASVWRHMVRRPVCILDSKF
jgi:hypothetical protein